MNELKNIISNELKRINEEENEEKGIYDLETIKATLYNYNNILKQIEHIAKILNTDDIKLTHNSQISTIDLKVDGGIGFIDELEKKEDVKEKLKIKYSRYCKLINRLEYSMVFLEDIEQAIIQSVLIEHKEIKEVSRILKVKNIDTILKKAILKLQSYLKFS